MNWARVESYLRDLAMVCDRQREPWIDPREDLRVNLALQCIGKPEPSNRAHSPERWSTESFGRVVPLKSARRYRRAQLAALRGAKSRPNSGSCARPYGTE